MCSAAIYGGTFRILEGLQPKLGILRRFVSLDDLANPASVIGPQTRIVWFESPINPTLRRVDVRAVTDACRAAGVVSAIDNTLPTRWPWRSFSTGMRPSSASTYPGLSAHPDHAIARRQMKGCGGVVTIDVKGGKDAAFRTFDRLKLIKRAASLGGAESICSLPILTTHYGLTDEELAAAGVSKGMIRISVGLDDAADLIAEFDQALRLWRSSRPD